MSFKESAHNQGHHFLPKCYLKRFSYGKNRKINVRKIKEDRIINPTINNIFKENGLYDLSGWETEESIPADGLERAFGETLEPIYEKHMSSKVDKDLLPNERESEAIALFCLNLYIRNPKNKKILEGLLEMSGDVQDANNFLETFGAVTFRNVIYNYTYTFRNR